MVPCDGTTFYLKIIRLPVRTCSQLFDYFTVEFTLQVNFMKKSGFGGVMVWTLDLDDYDNECCTGSYPLLREVNAAIGRIPANPMQTDCTKPVIVPLANETTTTPAGSTLEISEGTGT